MSKRQRVSKTKSRTTKAEEAEKEPVVEAQAEVVAEAQEADYSSKQYWDERYQEKKIEHEWYYSFDILEPILTQSRDFKTTDKVLELGCGDRSLIQHFQKFGIAPSALHAIDFSEAVIEDLKKQDSHRDINLQAMDARKLSYADEEFQFVIEKGTIDAMLSASEQEVGIENAQQLVEQAVRVMDKSATFVIVSHIKVYSDEFDLLMEEVILPALGTKTGVNWDVSVHCVQENDECNDDSEENGADKAEAKGEKTAKYGTVYVITAKKKKNTRGGKNTPGKVSFQVFEYSDDDEEGEDEDEDEENLCLPCS